MKGLNIKRLAAVATGAALVGTALAPIAAAAIGVTKADLIGSDGGVAVTVKVGTNAAVSDVVWAGNIAARIAQLATKNTAVTAGGTAGAGTATVADLKVNVSVGGTTTVTGAKTFFGNLDSNTAHSAEGEFTDQNVTNSNISALKYYGSRSYTFNNTAYSTTMQEKLNFTADATFDTTTRKALVLKVLQGNLKYVSDLGSGIPYNEAVGSSSDFSDDKNDNILIPFFGKDYLVKQISRSSGYVELVETSGDKDYKEGDKIEGLTDANGNKYYVVVGSGGVDGTTNKIKLTLYDANGTRIDGGFYSSGDVFFYKNGQSFLTTSLNISSILKATVGQTDVFTPTIYLGTARIQLYNSKGYPYDSAKATEDYDWTVTLTFDTSADKNKLLTIAVANTSRNQWNTSKAMLVGETAAYPENVGKLKFLGLQLPGFTGVSKTERTTTVTLGSEQLKYKDKSYEAEHTLPFYKYAELSNGGYSTQTIDGKTIYFIVNTTDVNVWNSDASGARVSKPDQNQCIGDNNYVNGVKVNLKVTNANTGALTIGASDTTLTNQRVGVRVDLNGMQLVYSGFDLGVGNCIYLTADGNITLRKESSSGTLIQELYYTDANALRAGIGFQGASDVTHYYAPLVDEVTSSTARVWLLLRDQNFNTQYNKNVALIGTDMTESGRDLKATIDRTYYVPNTPDLPADSNGGSAYNVNNYHVAIFQVDDQDSGETGAGIKDWNFAVDAQAGVGNLIALPNSQLSTYGFEAYFDYNGVSFALSENTNQSYPKAGYDDYGTNVSLSNHVATIVIPENRPQAELQVSGTSTTTTATGGDKLTGLAKGDSKSTSGGTTVTVDDITYTATCGAAAGSSCTPSEAVVVVPLSGDLVQTDALPAAGKVVIVGGYLVNSLAKGIGLEDKLKVAGDKVAEKLDNGNIVVAGYTAADTGAAAQELIDELTALLG